MDEYDNGYATGWYEAFEECLGLLERFSCGEPIFENGKINTEGQDICYKKPIIEHIKELQNSIY